MAQIWDQTVQFVRSHRLILKFSLYCDVHDNFGDKGHAANVPNLLQGKLNYEHSLYIDNYNSFSLASTLLRRNMYSTGTLRLDRKYISTDVKSAKLKKKEKPLHATLKLYW
uniref:PiggyBac transposable element-derived protein domain-containing protein n=1 Tax=Homalodisca liturata TaxID=320908 RepID=A0A1B6JZW0_9HEMI